MSALKPPEVTLSSVMASTEGVLICVQVTPLLSNWPAVTTAGQLDSNGVTWTQINTPSVDAITELSVTSGGFKADMGHASGGTVSFVSKSGTNEFHGTAYEFLRNQVLDAKGFFG